MFENYDFIWKFGFDLNLLFGKSKIFKFKFESNSSIVFKVVKIENDYLNFVILKFFIYDFIIKNYNLKWNTYSQTLH